MQLGNRLRAVALATAGLFVAAACGGSTGTPSANLAPASQQILRVNPGTEANSFDPTQQTYTYEANIGRQTFEGLLRAKADLSDVEMLGAQSYTVSPDGLTYTFKLRSGAKWSDGKPVVAADWVYGYQHLLNPALAAGYVDPYFDQTIAGGSGYANVDTTKASAVDAYLAGLGLSAPDANTFVIKLAAPAAYFKWVVTLWVGIPLRKDIVESAAGGSFPSTDATKAEAWANNAATIIGNGPFKISEIVSKDHITLVPNPNYWGTPAKLQQIVYSYIVDANTLFSKYQTGALDIITVPNADVTVVNSDPVLSKQTKNIPTLSQYWISYNGARAPLNNAMLRMALSKSVDRTKLVTDVEHGLGAPLATFIPKGMNGHDESDTAQSFDPAAAKADLVASGIPMAQVNALKFLTRNGTNSKTVNQFIVDQWNTNLGTNIQLDVLDGKTVTSRIRKGNFDIYGLDGWISDYPDDQDWYDIFLSASCHGLNWGCINIAGYDALIGKADSELDANQRAKDYATAQKMLVDQAIVGFMYQPYELDLIKPYVGGLTITSNDDQSTPGDPRYNQAYITVH
ncbi:MAG TPA: peptide ABC transporter substrate-binding protein [Candidatus Dormibacteraeota bacterium]|nr:peptide ABC transporter substrate-binding protein [Candidatus Dormibacteraeota bacterium]